eukprot:2955654-Pyramimonas_sp.AAC.1
MAEDGEKTPSSKVAAADKNAEVVAGGPPASSAGLRPAAAGSGAAASVMGWKPPSDSTSLKGLSLAERKEKRAIK